MNEIKKLLLAYCFDQINQKEKVLEEELKTARDSMNDQSKSSAGDKHETGRAMAQLEQEKLSHQFLELEKQKQILTKIDVEVINSKIGTGSLVETSIGTFFIAIGIGKAKVDKNDYLIISPGAPIAVALMESDGESVVFNKQQIKIFNKF